MEVTLTPEQLDALKQMVNRSQFPGEASEFVTGLKTALADAGPLVPVGDGKPPRE